MALVFLLLAFVWFARSGQPVTGKTAMRRAENAEFMGPGEIITRVELAEEEWDFSGWLGSCFRETYALRERDCFALALTIGGTMKQGHFSYPYRSAAILPVEPREGVTLATVETIVSIRSDLHFIFAFVDYQEAKTARLEMTWEQENISLEWQTFTDKGAVTRQQTGDMHEAYTVTAERESDGLFIFRLILIFD